MALFTRIITIVLLLATHSLPAYPPCFIISTKRPGSHTSSASAIKNTREHLAQQLHAGQSIYGSADPTHQPILHKYQIPFEEQQLLPAGFKDDFNSVSCLWHICHNPSVGYFHTQLAIKLEQTSPDHHDNVMRAEMRRWGMYTYPEFREFLQDLPVYNDYILHIAREIAVSNLFKESVARACPEAADHITQEAQRVMRLQQQEAKKSQIMKLHRDRGDAVHATFESQRPQLESQLTSWKQDHPERVTAYYKTLAPQAARSRYSQQHRYELPRGADTLLRSYNLDASKYVYETGNAFQHELMQEIVAGIHDSAVIQLPSQDNDPFAHNILYHTVHAFDDARETNSMGDCVSSIKLIDIAHTLLDYCKKVSSGAIDITLTSIKYGTSMAKGMFYVTQDSIVNTVNFVMHPLKSLGTILQLPFALGELINAYAPIMPDREIATPEEWRAYFTQLNVAQENCRQLQENVKEWWQTTPSEKIAEQAAYVLASIPVNAFIANRVMSFTAGALRYSKSIIMHATSRAVSRFRARKVLRLPGPICIDVEAISIPPGENSMYMLQPTPVPPSTIPPHVINMAALIGIPEATVTKALENFIMIPDLEGCPHILKRCFDELAHLPGFARLMKNTLTECALGGIRRGKGNFNELRSALVLKDKGHIILEMEGRVIDGYKPDIITDKYLIECKNWDFEHLDKKPDVLKVQTDKLLNQLANAVTAAKTVSKKAMFISKKPIPYDIKDKILNLSVEILEG